MTLTSVMQDVLQIVRELETEPERLARAQELGLSATRYYQVAFALLDEPAAWALAPLPMAEYATRRQARRAWRLRPRPPAVPSQGESG